MYVGITRAQRTLAGAGRAGAKGRGWWPRQPSRFIAEMALDKNHRARRPARKANKRCKPFC